MVKISEDIRQQFNQRAQAGWKSSQIYINKPSTSISPRWAGAHVGLLDPPRRRPFINAFNPYRGLRYYRFARQFQQYQQEEKYEKQRRDAEHYIRYLARLTLNARLRKRGANVQSLTRYALQGRGAYKGRQSYRAMRYLQAWALRHPTGELNYNPLFQSYNERKTFFRPIPHPWNYADPSFRSEAIFKDAREARARRDFYINQFQRLGRFLPEPQKPPYVNRSISTYPRYVSWSIQTEAFRKKRRKNLKKGFGYYPSQKDSSRRPYYPRRYQRQF